MRPLRTAAAVVVLIVLVNMWLSYLDAVKHTTGGGRTVLALQLLVLALVTAALGGAIVFLLRGQFKSRERPDIHELTPADRFPRITPPEAFPGDGEDSEGTDVTGKPPKGRD